MEDALKKLGLKIYTARKYAGMSRAELGRLTGLHETTVKRYEDGNIKSPNLEKLSAFAEVLKLNYDELAACLLPNSQVNIDKAEAFGKRLYYTLYTANPDISKVALVDLEGEDTELWKELIDTFSRLNAAGKAKALDYLADLKEHPKYKDDTGHFNKYLTLEIERNTVIEDDITPKEKEKRKKAAIDEIISVFKVNRNSDRNNPSE